MSRRSPPKHYKNVGKGSEADRRKRQIAKDSLKKENGLLVKEAKQEVKNEQT